MATLTKTSKRRETLKRGSREGASLGERALTKVAIAEIRNIGGQSHIDTGANTGDEIQARAELKASMAAAEYIAPDSAAADSWKLDCRDDPRYVPLSFLLSDLGRRVKVQVRGFSKDERRDIATDAAVILARWTTQGALAPIYLGPRGSLPLRRDWFDPEARTVIRDGKSTRPAPSAKAERAMRAAILQAVRDRNTDTDLALAAAAAELDTVSADADYSASTLAAEALRRDQESAEFAPSLPDTDAPELIAQALGVTLTAGRAMAAKGWKLSARQCAEQWQVSESRAENILSEGKREIGQRWPESAELISALAAAAPALRELLATRAYQAIVELRDALPWQDLGQLQARAENAVSEYRSAADVLPMDRRALELAARNVGWDPEPIAAAEHILRLMRAETERGRRDSAAAACGNGAIPSRAPIGTSGESRAEILRRARAAFLASETEGRRDRAVCRWMAAADPEVKRASSSDRVWSYGLEARTARQLQATDSKLATLAAAAAELAEILRAA